MRIDTVETPELGNRSYLVSSADACIVIDPQRDLDRLDLLLAVSPAVSHVLETHVHNDYVSGGLELAQLTGAEYGVNAADDVAFERLQLHDEDVLVEGGLHVRVVATPGHTKTHLAFVVTEAGGDSAVFTGGSLLFGTVGRTDLAGTEHTRELTRAQYTSARRLATLPAETPVFPTHGFGSFCSTGGDTDATASTLGDELQKNRVFCADSEDAFVDELIGSLGEFPTYYAHMSGINSAGAPAADLTAPVPALSAADVRARLRAGESVIDLRDRATYAAGRLPGTLGIALGAQLATYVGWLVPFGSPLTLIGTSYDDLAAARRQLVRIGYDDLAGSIADVAGVGTPRPVALRNYDDLAHDRRPDDVVLDVRRAAERTDGAVAGAVHIPLHELVDRVGELRRQRTWVHCVSGFRAATAGGMLADAGIEVLALDDHIDRAHALGLMTSARTEN